MPRLRGKRGHRGKWEGGEENDFNGSLALVRGATCITARYSLALASKNVMVGDQIVRYIRARHWGFPLVRRNVRI